MENFYILNVIEEEIWKTMKQYNIQIMRVCWSMLSLEQTNFKECWRSYGSKGNWNINNVIICHVNVFLSLSENLNIYTPEECNNMKLGVQTEATEICAYCIFF